MLISKDTNTLELLGIRSCRNFRPDEALILTPQMKTIPPTLSWDPLKWFHRINWGCISYSMSSSMKRNLFCMPTQLSPFARTVIHFHVSIRICKKTHPIKSIFERSQWWWITVIANTGFQHLTRLLRLQTPTKEGLVADHIKAYVLWKISPPCPSHLVGQLSLSPTQHHTKIYNWICP